MNDNLVVDNLTIKCIVAPAFQEMLTKVKNVAF